MDEKTENPPLTRKAYLRLTLLSGLVILALGGWLLHLRIHSPYVNS